MSEEIRKQWGLRTPSELFAESTQAQEWLVDGIIPRRRLVLVAGDSGLGKSPLCYQLGLAIAGGVPFLTHPVEKGKVLYLDGENGLGEMSGLVGSLSKHLGIEPPSDFLTFSLADAGPKWARPSALRDMITDIKPDLVVLDTISTFWPGIEEKNPEASKKYSEVRALTNLGPAFIMVHHLKKQNEDFPRPALEDTPNPRNWFSAVRGASALVNNADIRLGVDLPSASGVRNGKIELVVGGYSRVKGAIPLSYLERVRDEEGEVQGYSLVSDLEMFPEELSLLFRRLPPVFTFGEVKKLTGKSNSWVSGALGKLVAADLLRQPAKKGPYFKTHKENLESPSGGVASV